uniref:Uncharacterized protein n=1 Tax=Sphaerodactylus townsendi TaxID=933632 RepID=A0ACB8EI84_9SAUR
MPRKKDTVVSSEEESDEASYGRQTPDKQSGEEDSSPERARSAAAATGRRLKKDERQGPRFAPKERGAQDGRRRSRRSRICSRGPAVPCYPRPGLRESGSPVRGPDDDRGPGRGFSNLCSSSYGIISSRQETPMAKSVADRLEI